MNVLLSSDEQAIADLLPGFLGAELPSEKARTAIGSAGLSAEHREVWKRFAELGVLGTILPESLDGLGMGLVSAVAVLESANRPIGPLPIFQTIAHAVLPLSFCGEKGGARALEFSRAMTSGGVCASGMTLSEGEGLELKATKGKISISGEFLPFAGGEGTSLFVFVLERTKSTDICVLDVASLEEPEAVVLSPLPVLDLLQPCSQLTLKNAPFEVLCSLGTEAGEAIELRQFVLAAAELAGLGAEVLRQSVEFVKTREQFGRPVGSFQAIQHKLADMHVAVEQTRALARFAAWCADNGDAQFREAALAAKAFASDEIPLVIEAAIQAHGGMGFTFESDLHLYLRRAQTRAMMFGDAKELHAKLAELSFLGAS